MKVVHMTSGHPTFDTRIFRKQCRSLAAAGLEVTLIAMADADQVVDGVTIRAIEPSHGRLERFIQGPKRVFRIAKDLEADIFQFHDPELWGVGLKLQRMGRKVIYDAHENVPTDIMNRDYIPGPLRKLVSRVCERKEMQVANAVSGIVTVTEGIAARFPAHKTILARNYPVLSDMNYEQLPYAQRARRVVFSGGLSIERQARQMVESIALVQDTELYVVGPLESESLKQELTALPGWKQTHFPGTLKQAEYYTQLFNSRIGLSLVEKKVDYGDVSTNKVYEYMYAGIPMIVSPVSTWKQIVEEFECGLVVQSNDPHTVSAAINSLLSDPERAEQMGRRGRDAVERFFSWESEAKNLIAFYERIVKE
jgi:glycosyltransferase involved in cell wall biosynthesis